MDLGPEDSEDSGTWSDKGEDEIENENEAEKIDNRIRIDNNEVVEGHNVTGSNVSVTGSGSKELEQEKEMVKKGQEVIVGEMVTGDDRIVEDVMTGEGRRVEERDILMVRQVDSQCVCQ